MGDDKVVYTLTCPQNQSNSSYTSNYDVTVDGITWNAPGNQNNNSGWLIGGKNLTNANISITSKTPINGMVGKVKIDHNAVTKSNLKIHKVTLTVSKTADFNASDIICEVENLPQFGDESFLISFAGSFVFECKAFMAWENCYYRFTFNVSNSTSTDQGLKLAKIDFYEYVAPSDVIVNIGSTGFASMYYSAYALEIPENIEASTYHVEEGCMNISKTYRTGDCIPSGEAVVLYSKIGAGTFTSSPY